MSVVFGEVVKQGAKYVISATVGGGIVLTSILAWTGTSDLNLIKEGVTSYINKSEQSVSALASDYWGVVDSANKEIEDYQLALEQANGNITKLVEAYQQQEQEMEALEKQLAESYVSVEDTKAIIEKANEQINQANTEVKQVSTEVYGSLVSSQMNIDKAQALNSAKGDSQNLKTGGDKSVNSIEEIIPTETESVE